MIARLVLGVIGPLVASVAMVSGLSVTWVRSGQSARAPWNADAAVVLGAAVWPGGVASPALAQRARTGARLRHQGRVRWVFTTGGVGDRSTRSEGSVARELIVSEGLAPDDVIAETESKNTVENLVNARNAMRERGVRRVFVVSHAFHLARSVRIARDLGFEAWGVAADSAGVSRTKDRTWREAWQLGGYAFERIVMMAR